MEGDVVEGKGLRHVLVLQELGERERERREGAGGKTERERESRGNR